MCEELAVRAKLICASANNGLPAALMFSPYRGCSHSLACEMIVSIVLTIAAIIAVLFFAFWFYFRMPPFDL